jgi:hypothetical protein
MSHVDNTLGNILIKHNDKWRGDYYLQDNLTFGVNRSQAARFYLLKSGDTTILNGDRISLHSGNRTLVISDSNTIRLVDRNLPYRGLNSFIITNGTDNTDPVTYENIVFLISDSQTKTALKYDWRMDLISNPSQNSIISSNASDYRPRNQPSLVNSNYESTCESYSHMFEFLLEKADLPIIDQSRFTLTETSSVKTASDIMDGYKGIIMIILLMVILLLCIVASK